MAVTVTDDFGTALNNADSITNWVVGGAHSQPAADPDSKVQGTNCIEARINVAAGPSLIANNHGNTDMRDKHWYGWVRQSMVFATLANGGVRVRISSNTLGTSNFGEWNVIGQDKGVTSFKGWSSICVDLYRPYDVVNGTPPGLNAVTLSGLNINWLVGNGKSLPIIDQIKVGSKIFVKGGGIGTEGRLAELSTDDETNGRGVLKDVGGVFFCNAGIEFGDTGTLTTRFLGENQTLVFEDLPVSATHYEIAHVGNATGTNECVFGTSSGTGIDKQGANGLVIKAAGTAPFRITAIDSNVNKAHYFGCTLIGPSAGITADALRTVLVEDNSGGPSFTDDTVDANDPGANDFAPFPAGAGANDAAYFGHNARFCDLNINTGTAGAGTYTVTWEYWNGSAWSALTNVSDGSNGFKTTGAQMLNFSMPDDWAKTTVSGQNRYFIRGRRDGGTVTTNPNVTQVSANLAGEVRLEHANAEMISCTLIKMGTVRVRNGAFLKKCTISSSASAAKHGALDLGSTDPTANTVRDLNISGNVTGVLLKGTSTGTTTFNFRNFQFSGNTNDVRVDFPAGATININCLEGTPTTFTVQNVNGSTVNKVASFTLTLTDIPSGTNVTIVNASTRAELQHSTADGTGIVTYSHSGGETVDVLFMNTAYDPNLSDIFDLTLPSGNSSVKVQMISDPNYSNPNP